jgi:hypothetical protein
MACCERIKLLVDEKRADDAKTAEGLKCIYNVLHAAQSLLPHTPWNFSGRPSPRHQAHDVILFLDMPCGKHTQVMAARHVECKLSHWHSACRLVALPSSPHYPLAARRIQAGLHISRAHCEKSLVWQAVQFG